MTICGCLTTSTGTCFRSQVRECFINEPGSWDAMISYTQRNPTAEILAVKLHGELQKRGLTVWLDVEMDKRDEAAMKEGVEQSRCVIAIVSGRPGCDVAYFMRPFCLKELRWAHAVDVPVVPVVSAEDKGSITEFFVDIPGDLSHIKSANWEYIDRKDVDYFRLGVDKIIRAAHLEPRTADELIQVCAPVPLWQDPDICVTFTEPSSVPLGINWLQPLETKYKSVVRNKRTSTGHEYPVTEHKPWSIVMIDNIEPGGQAARHPELSKLTPGLAIKSIGLTEVTGMGYGQVVEVFKSSPSRPLRVSFHGDIRVTFFFTGDLGIRLATTSRTSTDAVGAKVTKIISGTQAEEYSHLKVGMVVKSVGLEDVTGRECADVTEVIKNRTDITALGRAHPSEPLVLSFFGGGGGGSDKWEGSVKVADQTPDLIARQQQDQEANKAKMGGTVDKPLGTGEAFSCCCGSSPKKDQKRPTTRS